MSAAAAKPMKRNKSWPTGNKTVDMVRLLAPIDLLLQRAGTWTQKTPVPPLAYYGYKGGAEHVTPVDFSKDAVAYHADRGRSVLDMALRAAFLLGVEQGARMERARIEDAMTPFLLAVNQEVPKEVRAAAIRRLESWGRRDERRRKKGSDPEPDERMAPQPAKSSAAPLGEDPEDDA